MITDDVRFVGDVPPTPTTSSIGPKVDQTSFGTGSHSAGFVTTGYTRKVGQPGVRDSTTSLVGLLKASVLHAFGRHDYVDELLVDWTDDGFVRELGTERICWLCLARDGS